ncbi:MAG: serine hydrolase [Chloroflexi bacterium]|nr:serine hydrolase [Chloroflexota bacterium]
MQPDNHLTQTIDTLIQESYKPAQPGVAVIVVKDGKTVFRKGHGMANLELDVPIEPDMVFRIGSVTKQFTAVAILMLAEQGKLSFDDSISKFLPDYPTHDYLITVKHLLTHTSGIKSYTSMPEWIPLWRKDFTVQELVDFFKHQPMLSAPGKRWAYNNSGYILLGAIIEKVTGQTYGQFVQKNIFEPLEMKQSYYDDPLQVIPRRVAGYDKSPNGFTNAAYISMTQPYAAGALASTVDDLALWDTALYTEKLLKPESLKQAHISYHLLDGSPTAYGFGWMISEYAGHRVIEHSGGIQGFRSHTMRLPDNRVFVAVLSNNGGVSPQKLAFKIAASVIGQPYQEPTLIVLPSNILARYEGVYETNTLNKIIITHEDDHFFYQYGNGPRAEIAPLSPKEFFFTEMSFNRLLFTNDVNGDIISVEIRGRIGMHEAAQKLT